MGVGQSNPNDAIKSDDAAAVKRLLKDKRRPIAVNETVAGQTPLYRAVTSDSVDVIDLLLANGADISATCIVRSKEGFEFEWTVMHEVCRNGNVNILRTLIHAGGDVNIMAHHQMAPLHVAAWHGHKEVVDELVHAGCDVNRLDLFQESALVIPICYGDTPVVETLLYAGCKLTSRSWGNTRKVRGKYEEDFRKTLYGRHGPYSLFLLAIKYSWLHIAGLLLQHGSNPNKYQIHDILKNIKSNIGKVDSEGCHLVRCLVACGYRFSKRDYQKLSELIDEEDHGYDEDLVVWLREQVFLPVSLKQHCRNTIRSQVRVAIGHASILRKLETFFLPRTLLEYLAVREYDYSCGGRCVHDKVQELPNRDPLYFAMPRRRREYTGHVYRHFWATSCCFKK